MPYTYEYERPAVTVDALLLGLIDGALNVLLIRRKHYPYEGMWALPGGFVDMKEDLEAAALRELAEETGVTGVALKQFLAFGDPERDPRTRIIAVVHYALVLPERLAVRAGDDAADARWFPAYRLQQTAFDHDRIIEMMLERLRFEVRRTPAAFDLLPESFTAAQLAAALGACLNRKIAPKDAERRIAELGILTKNADDAYSVDSAAARRKAEAIALFPF